MCYNYFHPYTTSSTCIKKYSYSIGDIAQRNIKALNDFLIEDKDATAANRQHAVEAVYTVYDHDTKLAADISRRLNKAFSLARTVISENSKKNQTQAADIEALSLSDKIWQIKALFEKQI
ncbi:MAG: hypothetical protein JRF40_10715, partial [Deltaproteobacteria bacterium]|nr:hypothetical protein [Deltaproteobacteria bacterium]